MLGVVYPRICDHDHNKHSRGAGNWIKDILRDSEMYATRNGDRIQNRNRRRIVLEVNACSGNRTRSGDAAFGLERLCWCEWEEMCEPNNIQ